MFTYEIDRAGQRGFYSFNLTIPSETFDNMLILALLTLFTLSLSSRITFRQLRS
jgi:hypothetical protein